MKAGGKFLRLLFYHGQWKAFRGLDPIPIQHISIGPNSIDVTLSHNVLIPHMIDAYDVRDPPHIGEGYENFVIPACGFILKPQGFILGCCRERFDCDLRPVVSPYGAIAFAQEMHGRSTLGRIGLCVHATAGYGDYGFKGSFTLELFNVGPVSIILYPDMPIGQIEFNSVHLPEMYDGAYSGTNHYSEPVPPNIRGPL